MSTTTTHLGLVKPDLQDAADITAFNNNWDILDTKLHKVNVGDTIAASGWTNGSYTWRNDNIKSATQTIELLPSQSITAEQLEVLQLANIVGTSQTVGAITFKAFGEVPKIDLPVVFIIRGDV